MFFDARYMLREIQTKTLTKCTSDIMRLERIAIALIVLDVDTNETQLITNFDIRGFKCQSPCLTHGLNWQVFFHWYIGRYMTAAATYRDFTLAIYNCCYQAESPFMCMWLKPLTRKQRLTNGLPYHHKSGQLLRRSAVIMFELLLPWSISDNR
jgi:hypothetical protein